MKKLLSIIGTVSIAASGVSTVISCGDNNSSKPQNETSQEIANKITKTSFNIANNAKKDIASNTAAIKTSLKAKNPTLTMSNLAKISFSFADTGVNKFVDDEATAIKATITVSPSDISYKDLTLVMNMNPAEKVAAAIKDPFLLLPQGLSNDVNDPKTKAAVLKAVKDNNPNVTQDFTLKSLTYTNDATSLVVNQEIKVIATIAFDGAEAMKNLYIVLAGTADEVGKLLDKQLKMSVPTGTNLNLSENAILKKQIFALTTNLLPPVLASQSMIQLTDKKLQIGDNSIAVNITIPTKDGESSKAQTTLNVNLSSNDGDT